MPGRERVPSFQIASGTSNDRDIYNIRTGSIFYNTDSDYIELSGNVSTNDLSVNGNIYVGTGLPIGPLLLAGAGALYGSGGYHGTATESSKFLGSDSYAATSAFNNSLKLNDSWHSNTNGVPHWIQFEFPYHVRITKYKIWPRNGSPANPTAWSLNGGPRLSYIQSGGQEFEEIHSKTKTYSDWPITTVDSITRDESYLEFTVDTQVLYSKFKLVITEVEGAGVTHGHVAIGEIAFYGYIHNIGDTRGTIFSQSIVADNIYSHSDDRLKHNEEEIPNALDLLNDLKPYKYQKTKTIYDASHTGYINSPWRYQIGLIAQDIQKIPYLEFAVQTDTSKGDDILGLAYNNFIGLLVQGIKDLNNENISIKEKIAQNKTTYDISLNNLQTKIHLLETENNQFKTDISNIKTHLDI